MKLAICDDQITHAQTTKQIINEYMFQKNISYDIFVYISAEKLIDNCAKEKFDAVLLDVQMPELNGMELASRVRLILPNCEIVFISAFLNFAPDGYKVNAIRFILKENIQILLPECLELLINKNQEKSNCFKIDISGNTIKLQLSEIVYFKASEHYVNLHFIDKEKRFELLTVSIQKMDEHLRSRGFLRIHKSYLVNMQHIVKINNYLAQLNNGEALKLSEKRYSELKKQFVLWRGDNI